MKRGLVIGKFLPLHYGHLALIRFASQRCDELIVSLSHKVDDPIPYEIREQWLRTECNAWENVQIASSPDDFDNEQLPIIERTALWAAFIRKRFPRIDVLFSSEEYGEPFAAHLNIPHESFDPDRKSIPVSATMIRSNPMKNWGFLPPSVRPWYVKKICLFGPESTGKSTMSKLLAEHYSTSFVPEVARELISSNDFSAQDIVRIGDAQGERYFEKLKHANRLLFCDTDHITTAIYARHYLGFVPPSIDAWIEKIRYDQYYFFDIDVPWVDDGLRDLGHVREKMREEFRLELEQRRIPFVWVRGDYESRFQQMKSSMDSLLTM
ncbi:MAG: AAA family ATPase [Cyclobacteriaceae bacterium]|nr:AAA family ATPase [Cyclobacteriaceae bacterium]